MHQNIFFELFDFNLNSVANGKVIVNNKVDQVIKEPVRLAYLLLPQNRFYSTELINFLFGYGNDIMPA
ncbi:hypothetical protein D3C73_1261100 [compost metagenome]